MNTEPLEPIDTAAAAEERSAAFSAPPFHWKDISLAPFAIGRESAWLSHCRRIGLPPLSKAMVSGEAFLGHAYRMIWFCANDPARWLAVWMKGGEAGPILLETLIDEWCAEHISAGDQVEVVKRAFEIYDRSQINRAQIVDEGEDTEGNESGLAPVRNTSALSARPSRTTGSRVTRSTTSSPRSKAGPTSTATAPRRVSPTNGLRKPPLRKPRCASASLIAGNEANKTYNKLR